jgi:hypothetical protein
VRNDGSSSNEQSRGLTDAFWKQEQKNIIEKINKNKQQQKHRKTKGKKAAPQT